MSMFAINKFHRISEKPTLTYSAFSVIRQHYFLSISTYALNTPPTQAKNGLTFTNT